ncbi:hypothetical protein GCM10027415_20110 [Humibacter ginsengisoli]
MLGEGDGDMSGDGGHGGAFRDVTDAISVCVSPARGSSAPFSSTGSFDRLNRGGSEPDENEDSGEPTAGVRNGIVVAAGRI